jgi:hypothetical protein
LFIDQIKSSSGRNSPRSTLPAGAQDFMLPADVAKWYEVNTVKVGKIARQIEDDNESSVPNSAFTLLARPSS